MNNIVKSEIRKHILKLALPAIAGLSSQMIVSLVDTAMVGRLVEAKYALAAMGLGVMATWALISFFSSFATGTHVLVARKFGANDFDGCGKILNSSLIVSFFIGIIVGIIGVSLAFVISHLLAADHLVGEYAGQYLHYRFMGIPFFLVTVSYRGFFFGIGKTKIFMFSGLLVNVLNIIFSYVFIYGLIGAPRMGLAGSGIGATLATICDSLFYFTITLKSSYRKEFQYFKKFHFDVDIVKRILNISIPVSFQNVFIMIGFLSFVAITGLIGTVQQAATQVVISSLFISFMPCFGFGIAVQTLVGNKVGSGKIQLAKIYGYETTKIATLYTLLIGSVFILIPRWVLYAITSDPQIVQTASPVLFIAGIAQVFYATGIVLANGLQAAGNTFYVMMSEVLTNWVLFIPLSYFLGVFLHLGLIAAWSALPIYIIVYASAIFIKFRWGRWQVEKT
jgi:multidrug resistance protein, MATE family